MDHRLRRASTIQTISAVSWPCPLSPRRTRPSPPPSCPYPLRPGRFSQVVCDPRRLFLKYIGEGLGLRRRDWPWPRSGGSIGGPWPSPAADQHRVAALALFLGLLERSMDGKMRHAFPHRRCRLRAVRAGCLRRGNSRRAWSRATTAVSPPRGLAPSSPARIGARCWPRGTAHRPPRVRPSNDSAQLTGIRSTPLSVARVIPHKMPETLPRPSSRGLSSAVSSKRRCRNAAASGPSSSPP